MAAKRANEARNVCRSIMHGSQGTVHDNRKPLMPKYYCCRWKQGRFRFDRRSLSIPRRRSNTKKRRQAICGKSTASMATLLEFPHTDSFPAFHFTLRVGNRTESQCRRLIFFFLSAS